MARSSHLVIVALILSIGMKHNLFYFKTYNVIYLQYKSPKSFYLTYNALNLEKKIHVTDKFIPAKRPYITFITIVTTGYVPGLLFYYVNRRRLLFGNRAIQNPAAIRRLGKT